MAWWRGFPDPFSLLRAYLFPAPQMQAIYALYGRLCRATGHKLEIESYGAIRPIGALSTTLSHLARKAATPPLKGTYLYLFTQQQKPRRILELGTHLGIGTLYLHTAAPNADIHTVEASKTLAMYARRHFALFGARIHIHTGTFEEVLPTLAGPWDMIYIDGDHRGPALEAYVTALYPQLRVGGWFVCDDIYWSRDMWLSWQKLRRGDWRLTHTVYPFGFLQR